MHNKLFGTQGGVPVELSVGDYNAWEESQGERQNWKSDPLGLVMGQGRGVDDPGSWYVLMFFPVAPGFYNRKPQLWGIMQFSESDGYSSVLYSAQRTAEDAFAKNIGLEKPKRGRGKKKKEVSFAA